MTPTTPTSLRSQIREEREKLELTQAEFADRLRVSPQTVSNWERAVSVPSEESIRRIQEEMRIRLRGPAAGKQTPPAVRTTIPTAFSGGGLDFETLPQSFEWLYGFLHKLAQGGARPIQVDAARDLLSSGLIATLVADETGEVTDVKVLAMLEKLGAGVLAFFGQSAETPEDRWGEIALADLESDAPDFAAIAREARTVVRSMGLPARVRVDKDRRLLLVTASPEDGDAVADGLFDFIEGLARRVGGDVVQKIGIEIDSPELESVRN